ncbi:hypothetical protein ON010_g9557 [Phytophthora cinnamomi]|nr:hypothetical protein ON010_g9557 [Phytophthora cinnamomi]
MLVQDAAESTAASPRGRSGAVQVLADAAGTSKSASIDGQLLYYKSNASSPRRIRSRPSRESKSPRNAPIAVAAAKSELLFPRELPPPLFFQKAPRRAKS